MTAGIVFRVTYNLAYWDKKDVKIEEQGKEVWL